MLLISSFGAMDGGKKCNIHLPNNKQLSVITKPKQLGKDLLQFACNELGLKEKTYFGLFHNNQNDVETWLQEDKKLSDILPDTKSLKSDAVELCFSVKFFEDSITVLKHTTTVEMFFLNALNQVHKGYIEISSDLGFELAALALQAIVGSYVSDVVALEHLNKYPILSLQVSERARSKQYCENKLIELYKNQFKLTRGEAIMSYMSKLEHLFHYGMHYFKVKDKACMVYWLGISSKGIFQFSLHDKSLPQLLKGKNESNVVKRCRVKVAAGVVCNGYVELLNNISGLFDRQLERYNKAVVVYY